MNEEQTYPTNTEGSGYAPAGREAQATQRPGRIRSAIRPRKAESRRALVLRHRLRAGLETEALVGRRIAHCNPENSMAHLDKIAKSSWMLTLASIAVVVAALYLAKGVLIPLTLAVLLSFLLSPVCDWLERRRLGRIPAVLVTASLGFTMLGIVVWTAVVQMTHLVPRIPEYQHNIEAKLNSVNEYAVAALSKVTRTAEGIDDNLSPSEQANEQRGPTIGPTRSASFLRQRAHCKSLVACSAHCSKYWAPPASSSCSWCSSWSGERICEIDSSTWLARPRDRDHADAGRRRRGSAAISRCYFSSMSLLAFPSASGCT